MPGRKQEQTNRMKKFFYLFCLGLLIGLSTSAQDDPVDNGPFTPSDPGSTAVDEDPMDSNAPDPNDIPVDGGLSLLLAAGAACGVRRLKRVG